MVWRPQEDRPDLIRQDRTGGPRGLIRRPIVDFDVNFDVIATLSGRPGFWAGSPRVLIDQLLRAFFSSKPPENGNFLALLKKDKWCVVNFFQLFDHFFFIKIDSSNKNLIFSVG